MLTIMACSKRWGREGKANEWEMDCKASKSRLGWGKSGAVCS